MRDSLTRQVATLRHDEGGQIAFLMLLTLPVVFILFALATDVGLWYFDHRMAQNQVDAATLAAVPFLPDEVLATDAVDLWLAKNGFVPEERVLTGLTAAGTPCVGRGSSTNESGVEMIYTDELYGDGIEDTVRVCIWRKSPSVFAGFSGIDAVYVSASAKAQVYPQCGALDIVMVLDNSGSIDDSGHEDLVATATLLIDEFCLDNVSGVRLGITRFRATSAPVHDMSDDATSLRDAVGAIERGGKDLDSGTNIVVALAGGAAQYPSGSGDRPNAPNKMIFITDGNDNRGNSDADIALASLATGAEVFAIGVGDVEPSIVDAIATDPDEDHAFIFADFESLLDDAGGIAAALTTLQMVLIE